MSNLCRVATFMLAVAPVIAGAQTAPQQTKPAPQAAPPASAQTSSPAPAAKVSPAANSQRYVTSPDNFYRPGAKPQPSTPAPSATTPAASTSAPVKPTSAPAIRPANALTPSQPVTPVAPVIAPAAVVAPQPVPVQPIVVAASAPAAGAATPAAVDYAGGKLTVVADNAPLGFVLNLIAAKTGAVIDLVPELQNEPVVARLGPAPVRDVMSALLDSPRIDYIVLGGGDETVGLQRVVVRMRHSFGLYAMSAPRPPQPKQEDPEPEEVKLDANGHLVSDAPTAANPRLAQRQRIENWQKAREAMRAAEVQQQAQERENDRNGSPDPPAPPQDNQPADPPQNPPENPPQL